MTTHDTECPWRRFKEIDPETDCQFCPALKRARADERERLKQIRIQVQTWRDIEQKATNNDPDNYFAVRAGGFVSACDAVLKLLNAEDSDE
jgi:hypothetical protein